MVFKTQGIFLVVVLHYNLSHCHVLITQHSLKCRLPVRGVEDTRPFPGSSSAFPLSYVDHTTQSEMQATYPRC